MTSASRCGGRLKAAARCYWTTLPWCRNCALLETNAVPAWSGVSGQQKWTGWTAAVSIGAGALGDLLRPDRLAVSLTSPAPYPDGTGQWWRQSGDHSQAAWTQACPHHPPLRGAS